MIYVLVHTVPVQIYIYIYNVGKTKINHPFGNA